MDRPRVYLETTIVSYLAARPAADIVTAAHQHVTWLWWDNRRHDFGLCISEVVLREAEAGDPDAAQRRLDLTVDLTLLALTDAARGLQTRLLASAGLPERAALDALHVSVAAVHDIDYLLTWNVRHIANAKCVVESKACAVSKDTDRQSCARPRSCSAPIWSTMKPNDIPDPERIDPIVSEIRAVRDQLLAAAGGDLDTLFNTLKASEAARARPVVAPPVRSADRDADAA